jgi:hypothetical protein
VKHGKTDVIAVRRNDAFCPGDILRVMGWSRADLFLMNETTLRLDPNMRFARAGEGKGFLDGRSRGRISSRTPAVQGRNPSSTRDRGTEFLSVSKATRPS